MKIFFAILLFFAIRQRLDNQQAGIRLVRGSYSVAILLAWYLAIPTPAQRFFKGLMKFKTIQNETRGRPKEKGGINRPSLTIN